MRRYILATSNELSETLKIPRARALTGSLSPHHPLCAHYNAASFRTLYAKRCHQTRIWSLLFALRLSRKTSALLCFLHRYLFSFFFKQILFFSFSSSHQPARESSGPTPTRFDEWKKRDKWKKINKSLSSSSSNPSEDLCLKSIIITKWDPS